MPVPRRGEGTPRRRRLPHRREASSLVGPDTRDRRRCVGIPRRPLGAILPCGTMKEGGRPGCRPCRPSLRVLVGSEELTRPVEQHGVELGLQSVPSARPSSERKASSTGSSVRFHRRRSILTRLLAIFQVSRTSGSSRVSSPCRSGPDVQCGVGPSPGLWTRGSPPLRRPRLSGGDHPRLPCAGR